MCRLFSTCFVKFQNPQLREFIPMKDFKIKGDRIIATPQITYDLSGELLQARNGNLSGEALWLSCSQQLKMLMKKSGLDLKSHDLKNQAVWYISETCDVGNPKEFRNDWGHLNIAHRNSYEDYILLEYIKDFWIPATERFCNEINSIYLSKRFKRKDFLSSIADYDKEHLMVKKKGIWKSLATWEKIYQQRHKTK